MNGTVRFGEVEFTPRSLWTSAQALARARHELRIEISAESLARIRVASEVVRRRLDSPSPIYGLNTGVGALRHTVIDREHLKPLQVNLLRSHACGVGGPLPRETVSAMWLHLLISTAQGHRGIRPKTVDLIVRLLNGGILAQVPSRGSVGASGDLAPAAHAALLLIGEGMCTMPVGAEIEVLPAQAAFDRLNLTPLELAPKEALSLMNGTQLTTAYACQVWTEAERLWRTATLALALSTLGFRPSPTITRLEALELHHPATLYAGLRKQEWLEGARLQYRSYEQDPYCFRCAPQVHGAVWKEIDQCEEWITEELGATADNPMVLPRTGEFLHSGNFHAIYPARVLDRLSSALTQLGSISERRINLAMDSRKTGLPDFLTPESGLNSGLMMAQTTAAALVSECKTLSFPASVDSIPTNCDQEDHVSMGPVAGLKAVQICRNVRDILAIEILAAIQAIHFRGPQILPPRLQEVYSELRAHVSPIEHDRIFSEDIREISGLIEGETLLIDLPRGASHHPKPAQC